MAAARHSSFGHGQVAVHSMLRAFPSPRDAGPSPRKRKPYRLHWGPPVVLQPAWCPVSDLLCQGEDAWALVGPRTPSLGRPWVGSEARRLEGAAISLQRPVQAPGTAGSADRQMLTSRPVGATQQREPYVHPTCEPSGGPGASGRSRCSERPSSPRGGPRPAATPGSSPRRSRPASPRTPRGASAGARGGQHLPAVRSVDYSGSYKWGLPEPVPPPPPNPSMMRIGATIVIIR